MNPKAFPHFISDPVTRERQQRYLDALWSSLAETRRVRRILGLSRKGDSYRAHYMEARLLTEETVGAFIEGLKTKEAELMAEIANPTTR